MTILITGGCGFIGSAVCRLLVGEERETVVNLDALTYAAMPEAVAELNASGRYDFVQGSVCDGEAVSALFARYRPRAVVHLAAETHVDRSIDGPAPFIDTNVVGTATLLDCANRYWRELPPDQAESFRFLHVSTDEVYGDLSRDAPAFTENHPYHPNSPYAASKASSDHLVRAWHRTYGLPVLITNCSNNYGPWQFPEKLIPLMLANAMDGKKLPVYGRGENIRDWLYVEDHARALSLVLRKGRVGQTYNVGGNAERRNIDLVETLCALLDDRLTGSPHRPHAALIDFVTDRPGHDFRYAIDAGKIESELGWRPRESFDSGLARTVDWYLDNRDWWQAIRAGRYGGERLGKTA